MIFADFRKTRLGMGAMNALQEWLLAQLRRTNESMREASIAADMDHAAISRFMADTVPSPDNCRKLAEHFGVPVSYVLSLVGHVDPPPTLTVFLAQIATATEGWSEEQKVQLLEVVRAWKAARK